MDTESIETTGLEDLDAIWAEEDETPEPADQPEVTEDVKEEPPKEEEKPTDQTETTPPAETFTLKHLDEVKTVTKDELVALAQKGLDYDRVRPKYDELQRYRQEADPALNLVKGYAEKSGMTVAAYLDYCRKQELMAQGVNEKTAAAQVELEKRSAELDAQTRAVQEAQRQKTDLAQQAKAKAEERRRDMAAFLDTYPGVKGEDIPKEVWARVSKGESLVTAYAMHKNQELEAALAAERQNKSNQQKTTGSLTTSGDSKKDDIDRWWNEDD